VIRRVTGRIPTFTGAGSKYTFGLLVEILFASQHCPGNSCKLTRRRHHDDIWVSAGGQLRKNTATFSWYPEIPTVWLLESA
jgi:hypothetical protein